jgi:hypothetical protein
MKMQIGALGTCLSLLGFAPAVAAQVAPSDSPPPVLEAQLHNVPVDGRYQDTDVRVDRSTREVYVHTHGTNRVILVGARLVATVELFAADGTVLEAYRLVMDVPEAGFTGGTFRDRHLRRTLPPETAERVASVRIRHTFNEGASIARMVNRTVRDGVEIFTNPIPVPELPAE